MPRTPAMTGAMTDFITSSGRITPMLAIPTPDLAVPYAAPMFANTNALAAPMKPKNGATASPLESSLVCASAPFVPLVLINNKKRDKEGFCEMTKICENNHREVFQRLVSA
ncbi:unnamed protein product [Bathycoccus prasinos]